MDIDFSEYEVVHILLVIPFFLSVFIEISGCNKIYIKMKAKFKNIKAKIKLSNIHVV